MACDSPLCSRTRILSCGLTKTQPVRCESFVRGAEAGNSSIQSAINIKASRDRMRVLEFAAKRSCMEKSQMEFSSLLALDRDIKTLKSESRFHSVLKLTRLLQSSSRALTSAVFQKFTGYWCSGDNSLRISLLVVAEDSCHILNSCSNSETQLKLISSVLESNDPIARSLTLRYLSPSLLLQPDCYFCRICSSLCSILS